jgi:predicted oxidoreductase
LCGEVNTFLKNRLAAGASRFLDNMKSIVLPFESTIHTNWNPIWNNHGIRILPGPSSLWLDARGQRLPAPNFPGFDTLGTLEAIQKTGYSYSWFILTQKIIEREFALSGSEQNPDLTGKSIRKVLARVLPGATLL